MKAMLFGMGLWIACGNMGGLAAAQPKEPARLADIPVPTPAEVRQWAEQLAKPRSSSEERREAFARLISAWALAGPEAVSKYPAQYGIAPAELLQFTLAGLDAPENPLSVRDAALLLAQFAVPVREFIDALVPRLNGRSVEDGTEVMFGLTQVWRKDASRRVFPPMSLLGQKCVFDYPEMAGHKKSKDLARRVDPNRLLQRLTEEDARWKLSDCEFAFSIWLICALDPNLAQAGRELAARRDDSWIVRGMLVTTHTADGPGLKPVVRALRDPSIRVAQIAGGVIQNTAGAEGADELRAAMEAADSLDRKLLVFSACARLRALAPDRERWRAVLRAEAKGLNRDIEMDIEELPESVQR